jgi:ABC-2 type transport system ATP-binding protein
VATVIDARGLGKRYQGRWALTECTLSIPAGHVVGLVGPNGAGKSTLLNLAVGLVEPTAGVVEVLGVRPGSSPAQLARVGFVAQDAPVHPALSVADHLTLGARLNPGWDAAYANRRIERLGVDPRRPAGKLSGGQRAQLALTLALAKRPELLILDEPVASLDPLARREFLQDLAEARTERALSVVLSSHLVSDLAQTCDYLVVLSTARVQAAGTIEELLAAHRARTGSPATFAQVGLEDLVLAYLSQGRHADAEVGK